MPRTTTPTSLANALADWHPLWVPEGDTLHRIARALQVLVPLTVRELSLPRQGLGRSVRGDTVTEVRAVGKNLLVFFSGGLVLHTHLKMTGVWHVYAPQERWRRSPANAVAIIDVGSVIAVCFHAPLVRLLERRRAERELIAPLADIDLIAASCDLDEVMRRLRTLPGTTPIGTALMDQQRVGGVGNVYKSEGLFRARLSPLDALDGVNDDALRALLADLQSIMRENVAQNTVVEGDALARDSDAVPHDRFTRTTTMPRQAGAGPVAVYGRAGRPCPACGAPIAMVRQGPLLRSSYFCPRCQPPRAQG